MSGRQPRDGSEATWFWDRYWHSDRVASCLGAGGRNYRPEICAGWNTFFAALPDGATVLDICTGNGAVALLAAEAARGARKQFTVHAIDRADIDPRQFLRSAPAALAQIHFHGKTPAESTGLPAHHFDTICGQYALEYTDRPRTIGEIVRLLTPGGYLRFIVHASEGSVVECARHQIDDARVLLERSDFFNLARRLLIAAFEAATTPGLPVADVVGDSLALQQKFQATVTQLRNYAATSHDREMFENVTGVVAHALAQHRRVGCEQILHKIDEAETETRAYRARLEAMVAAAMNLEEAGELGETLSRRLGRCLEVHPVRVASSGPLLGWELVSVPRP